jgi:hypothetical protein
MAIRLPVRVANSEAKLINIPLPPVKGHVEERSIASDACDTPAGMPIRVFAHFRGEWGDVAVLSVEAVLLRFSTHISCQAELRLPTEEMLEISVVNC